MEMFHVIVLTVALVILILLLTFIGIIMSKNRTSQAYPPAYNTCPDYWAVATDGSNCVIPNFNGINTGTLYTSGGILNSSVYSTFGFNSPTDPKTNKTTYQINFTDPSWKGSVCNQKAWATNNNIVWDGISNYNSC
jgi:hypothetical protein